MKQHLGDEYNIHTMYFDNAISAMHIDGSILIPKPGIVVLNAEKLTTQTDIFLKAGWKVHWSRHHGKGHSKKIILNWSIVGKGP